MFLPLEPLDVKMMLTELYKETENGTITSLIVRRKKPSVC